jgi:hypothetical protein
MTQSPWIDRPYPVFSPWQQGVTYRKPEFYTLPQAFTWEQHQASSLRQKVSLKGLEEQAKEFQNETGFEQIARELWSSLPSKDRGSARGSL